jgi:hypothetical protein
MASRTARAGLATALLMSAGLACAGCSVLQGTGTASPAAGPASASTSARPAATPASSPTAATPLASVLPFSPARLLAAVALASRFTAAWDSWSWDQPQAAWLAALRPMAAAGLYPALAQAAGTPAVLAQRKAERQSATATVTSAAIRDLTPGSVTVVVNVRQSVTSASGTSQTAASYAAMLTPAGSSWSVWDIEPADVGNS